MGTDVRHAGDIIILDVKGNLVAGDGDETIHEEIETLIEDGWQKILINLSKVDRLDSSGVGELVAGWKLARRLDADLRLLRLGDRARHTLSLAQILPLLHVYEDEATALAAFSTA
jgi:anti-sigma B factor antagonist